MALKCKGIPMSAPIVLISHFKVKEGKLAEFTRFAESVGAKIMADKPDTIVFLQYHNVEKTELSFVHVFPDAEALDRHNEGVVERSQAAFEYLELIRRELYGMPNPEALAMFGAPQGPGSSFHHVPGLLGGYLRLQAS